MICRVVLGLSCLILILLPSMGSAASSPLQEPVETSDLGALPWIAAKEHAGIVYLLFEFPTRILRFDMQSESWLPFIELPAVANAFAVDADGIYVAFDMDIQRFGLEGGDATFVHTAGVPVDELQVDGNLLFAMHQDTIEVVDKDLGTLLDSSTFEHTMRDQIIATSSDRLYARTTMFFPSLLVAIPYQPTGELGELLEFPLRSHFPEATTTWVFPGEQRVVQDAGIVFDFALDFAGSLAGAFDGLAFYESDVVVLRGMELHRHDADLFKIGEYELSEEVSAIFTLNGRIFGFFTNEQGAGVEVVPADALMPVVPGPPLDPVSLDYAPDKIVGDTNDVIYLLSQDLQSIFRWSATSQDYLETIPLAEPPLDMTYSASEHRLYVSYASGRIERVDLQLDGSYEIHPFVNSPGRPCGLSTADPYLFVCDPTGIGPSHDTYEPGGLRISRKDGNERSNDYVWSPINRKMYHLRDGISPNDIYWEDIDENGVIGDSMESPLHSSLGMVHPIRVHPDGSIVIMGAGRYHDALTLDFIAGTGVPYVDGQWLPFWSTLESLGEDSRVRYWDDTLRNPVKEIPLSGAPLRLIPNSKGLVAVTDVQGSPHFTQIDTPIYFDGFETGDTSTWSTSVGVDSQGDL